MDSVSCVFYLEVGQNWLAVAWIKFDTISSTLGVQCSLFFPCWICIKLSVEKLFPVFLVKFHILTCGELYSFLKFVYGFFKRFRILFPLIFIWCWIIFESDGIEVLFVSTRCLNKGGFFFFMRNLKRFRQSRTLHKFLNIAVNTEIAWWNWFLLKYVVTLAYNVV